jgi:hypothetical protein
MATISVQAQLTTQQLMDAIRQLDGSELESLTRQIMQRLAQSKAEDNFQREMELLNIIYAKKSAAFRRRFDRLKAKQRAFQLSPDEHNELLRLIEEVQAADVRYVEALAELARLRGVSLPELMEQLEIKAQ